MSIRRHLPALEEIMASLKDSHPHPALPHERSLAFRRARPETACEDIGPYLSGIARRPGLADRLNAQRREMAMPRPDPSNAY